MGSHTYNHLALKQIGNGAIHASALHLALHVVQQHSTQLLHVVLHERVQCLPAKGLGQLLGAYWLVVELQVVKDALQGQGDALGAVVALSWHLIDCLTQLVGEEESLQKGVHVAGGALVLQAHKAGVLLGVPADAVRCISSDCRLEDDGVVFQEAPRRVG